MTPEDREPFTSSEQHVRIIQRSAWSCLLEYENPRVRKIYELAKELADELEQLGKP